MNNTHNPRSGLLVSIIDTTALSEAERVAWNAHRCNAACCFGAQRACKQQRRLQSRTKTSLHKHLWSTYILARRARELASLAYALRFIGDDASSATCASPRACVHTYA